MQLNLHALPNEKDYRFGGTTRIDRNVLQADRDWTPYLPPYEPQSTLGFDTWGCVAYSALNCIETLEKRLYGSQRNNSDRFLVVGSGTTPNGGNSMSAVAEWNRTHGTIEEALYHLLKHSRSIISHYRRTCWLKAHKTYKTTNTSMSGCILETV